MKIPFGLRSGEWIHVSHVESGLKSGCLCPCCKTPLLAKKGKKVTHHFAHFRAIHCDPETVLHFTAKSLLFERISKRIRDRLPLRVHWLCSACSEHHTGNLLRRATQARLEHDLGICQPDITLLDEKDVPVAVIEVVVTHKPEESTVAFCRQRKITLIEYRIQNGTELEAIQSAEDLNPSSVDRCTRPKCRQCHRPLKQKYMVLVLTDCRRCKRPMKAAFILLDKNSFRGTRDFTDWDVKIASEKGAWLVKQYSETLNEEYFANTCATCRKWIGEHYLTRYAYDESAEREEYLAGYYCGQCLRDYAGPVSQIKWLSAKLTEKDHENELPELPNFSLPDQSRPSAI